MMRTTLLLGVSNQIKIYEFESLLHDSIDVKYPAVELLNKSKVSCVCWNKYLKNYLASADYDGAVQVCVLVHFICCFGIIRF